MDEKEYRATLSKDELAQRELMIPFKLNDIGILEKLNQYSTEFSKANDELIGIAPGRLSLLMYNY